jgi:hypothetical protein
MRAAPTCLVLLAACGGDAGPRPPPPVGHTPPPIEARPAGADDLVVATVDGRPVYGSCVRMQAEALGKDARAALDDCVRFELLAQEADRRGLRGDREVVETWRREMVRAVIEADFGPYQTLDDLPAEARARIAGKVEPFLHRPQMRTSHYVRAEVKRKAPPEVDAMARAIAQAVYDELKDDPGVLPEELHQAALRHAAGGSITISRSRKPYTTPEGRDAPVQPAEEPYRKALYAIPELGRISPPTRISHGWDVILWWDTVPAADLSQSFFDDKGRLQWFVEQVDRLAAASGMERWIDEARLAELAGEAP